MEEAFRVYEFRHPESSGIVTFVIGSTMSVEKHFATSPGDRPATYRHWAAGSRISRYNATLHLSSRGLQSGRIRAG